MIDFSTTETGDLPPVGELLASLTPEEQAKAEMLLRSFARSVPKSLETVTKECVRGAIARGRLTRRKAEQQ